MNLDAMRREVLAEDAHREIGGIAGLEPQGTFKRLPQFRQGDGTLPRVVVDDRSRTPLDVRLHEPRIADSVTARGIPVARDRGFGSDAANRGGCRTKGLAWAGVP
jgi:hypothetical protein